MPGEVQLNTRLALRGDTAENWSTANPVLLLNEFVIVDFGSDAADGVRYKFKIGDGTTHYNDLPFAIDLQSILDQIPHGGAIYQLSKTSLATADSTLLDTVDSPENGDIAVITTTVEDVEYEKSGYIYDGTTSAWVALSGMVDADKVIIREDITLAGNYTQVGNLTKTATGTAKFSTTGKSMFDALMEMLSKRQQPAITAQPAVSGFALSGAGAKEAGTPVSSASFGTAVLSAGSYTAFPGQVATGITAQSYSVDRVATPSSMNATGIASAASGTDDNGGSGFIIGDQGGENVVSSLAYKVTVTYGAGAIAKDNLGDESDPPIQIAAGSKTQQTSAMTPYRNIFYGTTSEGSPVSGAGITSEFVRGLTPTNNAYSARTLTVNVPAGATGVYIACIDGKTGVTKVINETALNADVTGTFTKQSGVMVEGANGYTAVAYNVWHFIPAAPYGNAAVLKVTLG